MTDGEQLLRGILERPDDTVARMVYADWLDEHGDPDRACFIRLQCQIADLWGGRPIHCEETGQDVSGYARFRNRCRCRTCSLLRREYMVSRRHIHVEWEAEVYRLIAEAEVAEALATGRPIRRTRVEPDGSLSPMVWVFRWRRGFIESVTCGCEGWLKHGPAIMASQPVTEVLLADKQPLGSVDGTFRWTDQPRHPLTSWQLPADLLKALPTGPDCSFIRDAGEFRYMFSLRDYDSEQAALSALSAAALSWARKAAGLPPLPAAVLR